MKNKILMALAIFAVSLSLLTGCSSQANIDGSLVANSTPSVSGTREPSVATKLSAILDDCLLKTPTATDDCKEKFKTWSQIKYSAEAQDYLKTTLHDDPDNDTFENWIEVLADTSPFVNDLAQVDEEQKACNLHFSYESCVPYTCSIEDLLTHKYLGDPNGAKKEFDQCMAECSKNLPNNEFHCARINFETTVSLLKQVEGVVTDLESKGFKELDQCLFGEVNTSNWEQLGCLELISQLKESGITLVDFIPFGGLAKQLLKTSQEGKSLTRTEEAFKLISNGIPTTITTGGDFDDFLYISFADWQKIVTSLKEKGYLKNDFLLKESEVEDINTVIHDLHTHGRRRQPIRTVETAVVKLQKEYIAKNKFVTASTIILSLVSYSSCVTDQNPLSCTSIETAEEHLAASYLTEKKFIYATAVMIEAVAGILLDITDVTGVLDVGAKGLIGKLLLKKLGKEITEEAIEVAVGEEFETLIQKAVKENIETHAERASFESFHEIFKRMAKEESEKIGNDPNLIIQSVDTVKMKGLYDDAAKSLDTFFEGMEKAKNKLTEQVFSDLSSLCLVAQLDIFNFVSVAYAYQGCKASVGRKFYESFSGQSSPKMADELFLLEWDKNIFGSKKVSLKNASKRELLIYNGENPSQSIRLKHGETLTKSLAEFSNLRPCFAVNRCIEVTRIFIYEYIKRFKIADSFLGTITFKQRVSEEKKMLIRQYLELHLYHSINFLKDKAGFSIEFIDDFLNEISKREIIFDDAFFAKKPTANAYQVEGKIGLRIKQLYEGSYAEYLQQVIGHEYVHASNGWIKRDQIDEFVSKVGGRDTPVGMAALEGFTELTNQMINVHYGYVKRDKFIAYSEQVWAAEIIYKDVWGKLGEKEANCLLAYFKLGNWTEFANILEKTYGMKPDRIWKEILYNKFFSIPVK